jgi:hypothetical protein
VALALILTSAVAQVACSAPVAGRLRPIPPAAAAAEGAVSITFRRHASFLIESPDGVRIVIDYNDSIRHR